MGHSWRGKKRTTGPDYIEDENGCWIWQFGVADSTISAVRTGTNWFLEGE